jgi:hypothetical protein
MPVVLSLPSLIRPKYSRIIRITSQRPAKRSESDPQIVAMLFFIIGGVVNFIKEKK